jgi:hypothetical protein
MITKTMITTTVKLRASGQLGQETLRSSPIVSRKKRLILLSRLLFSALPATSNSFLSDADNAAWWTAQNGRAALCLQARQELNPQPLVLETSALPIELLA